MFMKYPGLTPYHYCGNNPVTLVAPEGRDDYNYDDITNNSWKKFDIDNDRIVLNEIVVTA